MVNSSKQESIAMLKKWWNEEIAPKIRAPLIQLVTDQRLKKFRARCLEHECLMERVLEESRLVREEIKNLGFLTFDWLMEPSKLLKLLEGNYRMREGIGEIDMSKIAKELAEEHGVD